MNKLTETPPVTDLGTMRSCGIQKKFDEWSVQITGGTSSIWQSSHGRAFMAGWIAAMESAVSVMNQLHDSASMMSDPSSLGKRNDA